MKLSDMSTDQALDAFCELTPYINSIATDEDLVAELRRKIDPESVQTRSGLLLEGAKKINALVPIMLKTHRADVYGILSVMNDKTPEDIGRQNFIKTGMQIREVIKDKEFIDFFKSFAQPEKSG